MGTGAAAATAAAAAAEAGGASAAGRGTGAAAAVAAAAACLWGLVKERAACFCPGYTLQSRFEGSCRDKGCSSRWGSCGRRGMCSGSP